jgi:hypothetical protein
MAEIHTEKTVLTTMCAMLNIHEKNIRNNATINRHIRSTFGCTADVVAVIWNLLMKNFEVHKYTKLKNLLWMCSYFKTYLEYEHYAIIYGVTEKTFRYWVWYLADLVSKLKIVSKISTRGYFENCTNKFY